MSSEISVGHLRQNPTRMLREVQEGETYVVTDRGRPIAEIRSHRPGPWREGSELRSAFAAIGGDAAWAGELDTDRRRVDASDPWSSEG